MLYKPKSGLLEWEEERINRGMHVLNKKFKIYSIVTRGLYEDKFFGIKLVRNLQ